MLDSLVKAREIADEELKGFAEDMAEARKRNLGKPYEALVQARKMAAEELKGFAEDVKRLRNKTKRQLRMDWGRKEP